MLYAIVQPIAFLGLLAAFLLGLAVRAAVQIPLAQRLLRYRVGSLLPTPRRDVDPFGAVAAALGGTGWGKEAPTPETSWRRSQAGRRAVVFAAGPTAVILLGCALLAGYRYAFPYGLLLAGRYPSDVLHGISGPAAEQLLVSVGVGLICFGVVAFVPLPPLDGWGLLWLAIKNPSEGAQKVRYWLAERNIGVLLLLVFLIFPLTPSGPLLLMVLDLVATPLMRLVS
ncbi:MAG: hypothetical protein ACRDT1_09370 [Micromonosporaceae bacterium]